VAPDLARGNSSFSFGLGRVSSTQPRQAGGGLDRRHRKMATGNRGRTISGGESAFQNAVP